MSRFQMGLSIAASLGNGTFFSRFILLAIDMPLTRDHPVKIPRYLNTIGLRGFEQLYNAYSPEREIFFLSRHL